jgi:hypothetical protein
MSLSVMNNYLGVPGASFFELPHFAPTGSGTVIEESSAVGSFFFLVTEAKCAWSVTVLG